MERVYIESTIPSYLTANPSSDLIAAARQLATKSWWEEERLLYELFTSQVVIVECQQGDAEAAEKRLEAIADIPVLEISEEMTELAALIFERLGIPDRARDDALHIAIACVHEMDYLLSWNFKHIVNASLIKKLRVITQETGYYLPQICTPEELIP